MRKHLYRSDMSRIKCLLFIVILLFQTLLAKKDTLDKKAVDGMVLKMLWEKVYAQFDAKTKELAIKKIRSGGDYDNLINHLMKIHKDKAKKIISLVAEVMLVYMS